MSVKVSQNYGRPPNSLVSNKTHQQMSAKRGGKKRWQKCFMIANMRYGQSSVSVDDKDMSTLPNHGLLQIQIQGTP